MLRNKDGVMKMIVDNGLVFSISSVEYREFLLFQPGIRILGTFLGYLS
jgi:hypothetical protein